MSVRVFAPPQKAEQKAKVKYVCCACGHHGRQRYKCAHCSSEDVFDKTRPDWECSMCKEHTALYESICTNCSMGLLAAAVAELLGVEDAVEDFYAKNTPIGL